jgi:DNA polymerase-3 subunit delta
MRFYPKGFNLVVSKIQSSAITGVLLYGPDKGMIDHFVLEIQKAMSLNLHKLDYAEIGNRSLSQIFNSLNLLEDRSLIAIRNFASSLDKENKQVFEGRVHNFPILIADELSTSSSLRQFFEKQTNLASIACYSDLPIDLKSIIVAHLRKKDKTISNAALDYICENLNNDRTFLYGELDKLSIYCNDQKTISLEEVRELIVPSRNPAVDKLCIAFAKKDAVQYFSELSNLFHNNTPEMLAIRSLIRYYTNMYNVKLKIGEGFQIDEAIKFLSPPIFFMYVEQFKNIVGIVKVPELISTLKKLIEAEVDLKSGVKHNVFENIFYQRG